MLCHQLHRKAGSKQLSQPGQHSVRLSCVINCSKWNQLSSEVLSPTGNWRHLEASVLGFVPTLPLCVFLDAYAVLKFHYHLQQFVGDRDGKPARINFTEPVLYAVNL